MLLDVKKVEEEAQDEVRKERTEKAKQMLKTQMRVVESAEQVLANEKRKLNDIRAAIAEGNIR